MPDLIATRNTDPLRTLRKPRNQNEVVHPIPEMGVTGAVKSDILRDVLDMLETESVTWADRMRDEGRREGRREGRDEGLAGERKLLLRLARIRFKCSAEHLKRNVD